MYVKCTNKNCPIDAILMSTHNIQFHDKIRKFTKYLFSWAVERISQSLKNGFEWGMVNKPSVFQLLRFELLRFECIYQFQWHFLENVQNIGNIGGLKKCRKILKNIGTSWQPAYPSNSVIQRLWCTNLNKISDLLSWDRSLSPLTTPIPTGALKTKPDIIA